MEHMVNNKMKGILRLLVIAIIVIGNISCTSSQEEVFEIIGKNVDRNPIGPATYTIYTNLSSHNDSTKLFNYSEELLKGRHIGSSIGFYKTKSGTPMVNENHGLEYKTDEVSIFAIYRFNKESELFNLEYIP